jgi:hypothetical protein
MKTENKYLDTSWDFRTANVKEYTHCYHNYPAMMIPQIANRLINLYGIENASQIDNRLMGGKARNVTKLGLR